MVYNYISSNIVVFDVFDRYNIKSEEFINRTPNWILSCLEDIQSYYVYVDKYYKEATYMGRFYLPEDFKRLRNAWMDGVEMVFNGGLMKDYDYECDNTSSVFKFTDTSSNTASRGKRQGDEDGASCGNINVKVGCEYPDGYIYAGYNPYGGLDLQSWINGYRNTADCQAAAKAEEEASTDTDNTPKFIIENGWFKADRDGEVVIKYAALPMEYDENNALWFPLMPDNEDVRTAIGWYIMSRILYRGYIHPVLNLNNNNPYTNPAIAYKQAALKARMSCAAMNMPMRKEVSKAMKLKFGAHNGYKERP